MKPLGDVVAPTAAVVDPAATAAAAVVPTAAAAAAAAPASGSKAKYDMTVKDVPFDGKDGKPHEGPFVEVDNSRSKPSAADVDETPPKTPVYIDGKKVPESNDGVMDDKNRVAPKKGTTGMAGGVSEKDKQRKAKEGQTGERVENTPETPKEVPDLPHHEEKKIHGQAPGKDAKDEKDKKETKETTTSEGDVSGIGVSWDPAHSARSAVQRVLTPSRNQQISPTGQTTRPSPSPAPRRKTTSMFPRPLPTRPSCPRVRPAAMTTSPPRLFGRCTRSCFRSQ